MDWHISGKPQSLDAVIEQFETLLPGWWWTMGNCNVSADASCAPTGEGPDAYLIAYRNHDERFDGGFHLDVLHPAHPADSLAHIMAEAVNARDELRKKIKEGAEPEMPVDEFLARARVPRETG